MLRSIAVVLVVFGLSALVPAACSGGESGEETTTTTSTAPPAAGSGEVEIATNPVPVPADGRATVQVRWTGQEPRKLMFVSICRTPSSSPGFEAGIECSPLSELNPNGTPDGSGTVDLEFFRGRTPDGDADWGCFAPGDRAPEGVEALTTCYVRVTNDVVTNNEDARDVPFTLTDP